jgi:hypothetical protein
MKIQQTKPAISLTSLFLIVVCGMNILVKSMQVDQSPDGFTIFQLLFFVEFLALVVVTESWRMKTIRQGNVFLYLKSDTVFYHEKTAFGNERWKSLFSLNAFDQFYVRKRLNLEMLVGINRKGKKTILFRSGLFDRPGSEIAALFNKAHGSVVAAYREDKEESKESMVS